MTRNNLDNPIFLFILLIFVVTVNIISSIHFFLIMLAGILFTAFYRSLRKRYLYSLFFVTIAFLFIEINTGLKPFSLSLLSLFIYIFILPRMENTVSYNPINSFIYIIFFYLGLLCMWIFQFGLKEEIFTVFAINALIDLIFLGVFF